MHAFKYLITSPLFPSEFCPIRPRSHVSGYFIIRNCFFPDSKISPSTRSVFKSNSSVHTYPIKYRFTLVPKAPLEQMSSEHAPWSEIAAGNLLCSPDTCRRYISLLLGERLDTLFTPLDLKNPDSPVHTLSDSLRIYFFSLWRADLFFSGFAVEFAGCLWTVAVSGKKKLRI